MNELLTVLGNLIATFGNLQGRTVTAEHVALLKTQLGLLKDEFTKSQEENAKLKQRIRELEQQAAASLAAKEYEEERGALFKRRPGGGYYDAVYCPLCHIATAPFPPGEAYSCQCGWIATFKENELKGIIASLPF